MDEIKQGIIKVIEEKQHEIINLCRQIHSHPEIGFEEFKAVEWITELLEKEGFSVEKAIGNLPTAFKAVFKGKEGGPKVAFITEYYALPELGHGCGHNIIAASSVGAAIGLVKGVGKLYGEVMVIGAPAEEFGGGKIILVEEGIFDDVDYGLMLHPGNTNLVGRGSAATTGVFIEFEGKPAHSSIPEYGINALQAMIQVFNGIDGLRGSLQDYTRINGIITHGGSASNVIPDYSRADFTVRTKTRDYLDVVLKKIEDIVFAAEKMTGAKATIKVDLIYAERYSNKAMDEVFKNNYELLGEETTFPVTDKDKNAMGASDIGNVSLKLPIIHPYIKITDNTVVAHTKEFTEAATSDRGMAAMIKGAQTLALTGWDILSDSGLQKKIKDEFEVNVMKKEK